MAGYGHTSSYHRSPNAKQYIAAKIAKLTELDFLRTPPEQWTDRQRAHFNEWCPDPVDLATEMIADKRFAQILLRLGMVHAARDSLGP